MNDNLIWLINFTESQSELYLFCLFEYFFHHISVDRVVSKELQLILYAFITHATHRHEVWHIAVYIDQETKKYLNTVMIKDEKVECRQ